MVGLPTPDEVFKLASDFVDSQLRQCTERRQQLIDSAKRFLIVLPPLPACPSDTLIQWHKDLDSLVLETTTELQNFAATLIAGGVGATIAYNNTIELARINATGAVASDDDQARHLAAAATLVLATLQPRDPRIKDIGKILLAKGFENSLFHFLAEGLGSPLMLAKLMARCPDPDFDKQNIHAHEQWIWERADALNRQDETMYWDCIFAANLWKTGALPLRAESPYMPAFPKFESLHGDLPGAIRDHIGELQSELSKRREQLASDVVKVIADLGNAAIRSGVTAAIDEAKRQLEEAARRVEENAKRLEEERRRLEEEARRIIPVPTPRNPIPGVRF
jgi:hypothetical protein